MKVNVTYRYMYTWKLLSQSLLFW